MYSEIFVVLYNIKLCNYGKWKIMKYYIQIFSKQYAFCFTFISCQTKIFMVDKKGFQGNIQMMQYNESYEV